MRKERGIHPIRYNLNRSERVRALAETQQLLLPTLPCTQEDPLRPRTNVRPVYLPNTQLAPSIRSTRQLHPFPFSFSPQLHISTMGPEKWAVNPFNHQRAPKLGRGQSWPEAQLAGTMNQSLWNLAPQSRKKCFWNQKSPKKFTETPDKFSCLWEGTSKRDTHMPVTSIMASGHLTVLCLYLSHRFHYGNESPSRMRFGQRFCLTSQERSANSALATSPLPSQGPHGGERST